MAIVALPMALLDTSDALTHDVLKGDAITAAGVQVSNVTPDTEVVVIHFPPVEEGHSVRLRISETYTTPESYRLEGPTSSSSAVWVELATRWCCPMAGI